MSVFPQSEPLKPGTSEFRGVVLDRESVRIPKASVLIEGPDYRRKLESNADGEFKLELPAGKYQFTVEKPHFKRLIVHDFCIGVGSRISYEFQMEIGECNDCDWIIREKPGTPNAPPNKALQLTAR
jgi:hypothetical protein